MKTITAARASHLPDRRNALSGVRPSIARRCRRRVRRQQLRVPAWTKSTLANGADFIVSEKHDLPLVSFSITFIGGADQIEAPAKRGVAGVTAAMMLEGTATKDGEALSNALQLLGTSVQTGDRRRERHDPLHLDDREVRADAGDPRRHPREPDLPRRGARAPARAAAGRADPGQVAGDGDRRHACSRACSTAPAIPSDRPRPKTRSRRSRATISSRCTRPTSQPGARARHRGRRRQQRGGEGERRQGAGRLDRIGRAAGVHLSGGAAAEADDHLPGRSSGRGAVERRDRHPRSAARHARLLRARRRQHDARRPHPVAAEREHPRGQGLQLRRAIELRLRPRARARSAPEAKSSATRPTSR